MNLNFYIKSKALKDYYLLNDYEITPLQAAYVIFKRNYKSYKNRQDDLMHLIQNTEDFKIDAPVEGVDTFHELLFRFIKLENQLYEEFKMDDQNAVFVLYSREEQVEGYQDIYLGAYKHYADCIKMLIEYSSEEVPLLRDFRGIVVSYKLIYGKDEFVIRKQWFDHIEHYAEEYIDKNLVLDIWNNCESELDEIRRYFYNGNYNNDDVVHYDFLFPFKRGDILKSYDFPKDTIVFGNYIDLETDVKGYRVTPEGKIFEVTYLNPFEFEYAGSSDSERITIAEALSNIITDKFDICDFLSVYDRERMLFKAM